MKNLFAKLAVLAALAAVPAVSQAGMLEEDGHFYAGGAVRAQHIDATEIWNTASTTARRMDFECGYDLSVQVGYAWESGLRAEVEGSYSSSDNDNNYSSGGGISATSTGDRTEWRLMANVLYDFDLENHDLTPYLGAGLGVSWVEQQLGGTFAIATGKDDDTVFAYQLIGGISMPVSDGIDVFADYRYFGTTQPAWTIAAAPIESRNHGHRFGGGANFGF